MKLLFTLTLIVIHLTTNAQLSSFIGGGAGISSKRVIAGELTGGVEMKNILFNVSMLSHLSDLVDHQTAFNFKLGYVAELNEYSGIELTGGVALNLRSVDTKSLNTISPALSVVYVKDIYTDLYRNKHQTSQFYTGIHYIERAVVITVGLRFSVSKQ